MELERTDNMRADIEPFVVDYFARAPTSRFSLCKSRSADNLVRNLYWNNKNEKNDQAIHYIRK